MRANTLIMKTLEEEVTLLTSKKDDLNERISELETGKQYQNQNYLISEAKKGYK